MILVGAAYFVVCGVPLGNIFVEQCLFVALLRAISAQDWIRSLAFFPSGSRGIDGKSGDIRGVGAGSVSSGEFH
jgi:hypothetical protein